MRRDILVPMAKSRREIGTAPQAARTGITCSTRSPRDGVIAEGEEMPH